MEGPLWTIFCCTVGLLPLFGAWQVAGIRSEGKILLQKHKKRYLTIIKSIRCNVWNRLFERLLKPKYTWCLKKSICGNQIIISPVEARVQFELIFKIAPLCFNHQSWIKKNRWGEACRSLFKYYIPMEWYHQHVFFVVACIQCTVFSYIWQQEIYFRTNKMGKHFSCWLLQCQIKNLFPRLWWDWIRTIALS